MCGRKHPRQIVIIVVNLRKLFYSIWYFWTFVVLRFMLVSLIINTKSWSRILKSFLKTALWYTYSSILSKYGKKRQQLGMKSHFCCLWWWRFCIQGIWTTMNVLMWFMSYFERLTLIIFTKTFLERTKCNFYLYW